MFINLQALQEYVSTNDLKAIDNLITTKAKQKSSKNKIYSYLMLSAHNLKHLSKINDLSADAIMLNLEDGVSKELKPLALRLAILAIQHANKEKNIIVRVNPLDEGGIDEIKALNAVKPDAIRVPKIKGVADVELAQSLIDADIQLHLSIETKESFNNIRSLKTDLQVTTFYLGILDLFADLKLPQSLLQRGNPTCDYILSKFLIDCKSCGVQAVGFTYQDHNNSNQFQKWCEYEKTMGYSAKSCISPKQVEIVNKTFTIDNDTLTKAKKIIQLFEQKQKEGISGFDTKEFGFIDEPIYKDAVNTVSQSIIYV